MDNMRQRFCANCGSDLTEYGVYEYFNVNASTQVSLNGMRGDIYGETDIHYDSSKVIEYECGNCFAPVTTEQGHDIARYIGDNV